jgi:hypothetical protein
MRSNYIPALLLWLALTSPLWAGQHGQGGGAPHRESAPAQRYSAPRSAPQARQAQPSARGGFSAPRPTAAPHGNQAMPSGAPITTQRQAAPQSQAPRQIIRGQGPHNGDWLRNSMHLPASEQQKRLEQDQHFRQLPQQRQEQLKNRLQNFNSMPPQERQRVLNRMEMMEHLKPEQQRQAVALFGQFRGMNPQRKDMMRRTLHQMRGMPLDARERLLNSPETHGRYSPQEIQMLL